MTDLRTLDKKLAHNDEQRLEWIRMCAEFVANAENDDEWGGQLNELINSQVGAARYELQSGLFLRSRPNKGLEE